MRAVCLKLTLTYSGCHGNPIGQRLDIAGKSALQSVQTGLQRADPVVVCRQLGPQRLDHRACFSTSACREDRLTSSDLFSLAPASTSGRSGAMAVVSAISTDRSAAHFIVWSDHLLGLAVIAVESVLLRGSVSSDVIVQCCFTSTETKRRIREGEPRTATSIFTRTAPEL